MIDVLSTIARLQQERREKHIEPDHVPSLDVKKEVVRQLRAELNRLYKEGRIGTTRTLNGTAVYVKETK